MRSRFSAFAVRDAPYLLATWHSSTRPPALDLPSGTEWQALEIVATTQGRESDEVGTVEFVASFWDSDVQEHGQLHENSHFVRKGRHWFYVGLV